MSYELQEQILIQDAVKEKTKRMLARKLIQQIVQLYSTIIQKVENGIGVLWEEFISQELYSLAKKKVQNDLIKNLNELEDWFQNIAENIKDKFNNLSENLMAHFNVIIETQSQYIDQQKKLQLEFTQDEVLLPHNQQGDCQSNDQNKQSLSFYETCTQSSKEEHNGVAQMKKLCLGCEDHLNEAFEYCSKHQFLQRHIQNKDNITENKSYNSCEDLREKQFKQRNQLSPENRNHDYSLKKIHKRVASEQIQQEEQNYEGGLFEVFFGLLEAFEI